MRWGICNTCIAAKSHPSVDGATERQTKLIQRGSGGAWGSCRQSVEWGTLDAPARCSEADGYRHDFAPLARRHYVGDVDRYWTENRSRRTRACLAARLRSSVAQAGRMDRPLAGGTHSWCACYRLCRLYHECPII